MKAEAKIRDDQIAEALAAKDENEANADIDALNKEYEMEVCSGFRCSGYRGKQTKTLSGRTCQAWASQSPHKHTVDPRKYTDVGISG